MNDYITIYLAIYPNEFASKTVVQFKRTGKRYKVYDVVVTREEDDKQWKTIIFKHENYYQTQ